MIKLAKGDKIKLVNKMGVFDNIGEICEVIDVDDTGVSFTFHNGLHYGHMGNDEVDKYFVKVEEEDTCIKNIKNIISAIDDKIKEVDSLMEELKKYVKLYQNHSCDEYTPDECTGDCENCDGYDLEIDVNDVRDFIDFLFGRKNINDDNKNINK